MKYSKQTQNLLISMYPNTIIDANCFDISTQNNLSKDKIITPTEYINNTIVLTDIGKAYVESLLDSRHDKRTAKFRFWIPVIISLIALIKSFAPEIIAIIHAIVALT